MRYLMDESCGLWGALTGMIACSPRSSINALPSVDAVRVISEITSFSFVFNILSDRFCV